MSAFDEEDFFFFYKEACENNHKLVNITEMLIWSCTNVLLNNLYLKNNNNIAQEKQRMKRKVRTVL